MRDYAKQQQPVSRTIESNPKAANQASISEILQRYKKSIIQPAGFEDEDELLQGKFSDNPIQQTSIEEKEPLQPKSENKTGLPDELKAGIENMSGYSMDDVKVHYNSDKPAQLNALAYAQGTDIHVASGQEKHLPHEAWHVVQQKQGRVQPIMQMQGVNVNDNEGLEREADVMGEKVIQNRSFIRQTLPIKHKKSQDKSLIQRVIVGEESVVGKYAINWSNKKYYKIIEYKASEKSYILNSLDENPLSVVVQENDTNYGELESTGKQFTQKEFTEKFAIEIFNDLKEKDYILSSGKKKKTEFFHASPALLGSYNIVSEIPTEIKSKLFDFLFYVKQLNAEKKFSSISDKFTSKQNYKDWFHGFSNVINLLTGQKDLGMDKMQKILKYYLTQFQIQATYSAEDSKRLGRDSSPLVLQGYARGIKTGLWNLHRKFREDAVNAQLQKATGKKDDRLDKKFYVFPANKPFEMPNPEADQSMQLQIKENVPADINSGNYECVFIQSLQIQLVKFSSPESKSKKIGTVHSYMGGKGLRTSAGEAAEKAAEEIALKIKGGKVDEAMKYIKEVFETDSEPVKSQIEKADVSPQKAFGELEFSANTMLVPYVEPDSQKQELESLEYLPSSNPLTSSSIAQLTELEVQYRGLVDNAKDYRLPFFIRQNVEIVKNLIDNSIGISFKGRARFFDQHTPSMICIDLINAMHDARIIIKKHFELCFEDDEIDQSTIVELISPESNILIEKFYQQMQKIHHAVRFQLNYKGNDITLDSALKNILPLGTIEPILTNIAPHGLEMIHHIQQSLSKEEASSVAFMAGAYYETPELFPGGEQKEHVSDISLKGKKVIVLEPHPNNAASKEIHPHDPLLLLDTLFTESESSQSYTVIMDVTLNHLGEKEITTVLEKAKQYIEDGRLNLILLQSGTKFFQNGMDLVNIGTSLTFNNDGDNWKEFNKKMQKHEENVSADDKTYIANMLSKNKELLKGYLEKIRKNTLFMRSVLLEKLSARENAFEMCINTDQNTVYVSFMPKKAFIIKKKQISEKDITQEIIASINKDLYMDQLLPSLRSAGLPSVDRSSFGFNVTNFGECYTTVRITMGIEETGLLNEYAEIVSKVGKNAWSDCFK